MAREIAQKGNPDTAVIQEILITVSKTGQKNFFMPDCGSVCGQEGGEKKYCQAQV
jgi:hypothetical protein